MYKIKHHTLGMFEKFDTNMNAQFGKHPKQFSSMSNAWKFINRWNNNTNFSKESLGVCGESLDNKTAYQWCKHIIDRTGTLPEKLIPHFNKLKLQFT